ncbi:MAG: hypothetical protein JWN24_1404 [Phycisphaerales bacterium]|nr:hypothetical protein [Phycisphaerales bacterium]
MPSETYQIPPRIRLGRALGRIVFAVVWTMLAGELFLRVFAPQPLMPRAVIASDIGIRMNKPNDTYWQRSMEVNVRVHINSQGIRADSEIPLEKPTGVKRIVVLGDSNGLGYEVALKDSFPMQMADRLNAAGENVQVVNLSVAGYGTAEELLTFQHRGLAFHPDMVLLAWHFTDLDDNVRSHLFALEGGRLVRDRPTYLPGVKTRLRLESIPGYVWLERNSEMYSFIREKTAGKLEDMLPGAPDVHVMPKAPAGPPTYRERLAVALLKEIQDQCERNGIRFLILDVPSRFSRTDFASEFPARAAEGVAQFDVVSPLHEFQTNYKGEKMFWERGNGHPTVVASHVIGRMLAEHILERKLLAGSPTMAR